MLIKQVHQKSAIFACIGISQILVLSFNQMCAMGVMFYLSNTAISNIKGSSLISKNNAINLMENADLT